MMKALTNAVMKAKISRPVPKALMKSFTPAAFSSATWSPVTTSVPSGSTSSIAACTAVGVGALGEPDVDRVDLAVGAEVVERGVEVEGDDRRAAEAVGVAEADRRGDRAFESPGVGDVGDLVADLEVRPIGRRLVDRQLVRADRRLALLERDAGEVGFGDPTRRRASDPDDVTASPSSSIELGVPAQRRLDRGDAVDRGDLVGERGIDRLAGVVGVELLDAAHLEVDVAAELGEQVVERCA